MSIEFYYYSKDTIIEDRIHFHQKEKQLDTPIS